MVPGQGDWARARSLEQRRLEGRRAGAVKKGGVRAWSALPGGLAHPGRSCAAAGAQGQRPGGGHGPQACLVQGRRAAVTDRVSLCGPE